MSDELKFHVGWFTTDGWSMLAHRDFNQMECDVYFEVQCHPSLPFPSVVPYPRAARQRMNKVAGTIKVKANSLIKNLGCFALNGPAIHINHFRYAKQHFEGVLGGGRVNVRERLGGLSFSVVDDVVG